MDRRNFLKGAFGGVTAAGLIVAATPAEVEAFASGLKPDQTLVVPESVPVPTVLPEIGEMLFNHKGEPVAILSRLHMDRDMISIGADRNGFEAFAPGAMRIKMEAIAHGPVWTKVVGHHTR